MIPEVLARWRADRPPRGYGKQGLMVTERNSLVASLRPVIEPGPGRDRPVVIDLGTGGGGPLLYLLQACGETVENITVAACDLDSSHFYRARNNRPEAKVFQFVNSDAAKAPFPDGSADVVVAYTLFSSLPDAVERAATAEVHRLLRPGGTLLWYDMRMWSPWNRQVHRISQARLGELFPGFTGDIRSVTLMPPLGTLLAGYPKVYAALARVPALRSHLVAVLRKPGGR